jgi:hypothetical protein
LSQNLPNNYRQTDNSNALMRPPKIGKNWFNTNGNCGRTGTDAGFCTFYFSEMIGFSSKNNGYEKLCEKNVLCRKKQFLVVCKYPHPSLRKMFFTTGGKPCWHLRVVWICSVVQCGAIIMPPSICIHKC